jgi:2-methylcitrate dehydratase PrpD
MSTIAEQLAGFVAKTNFETIPREVIERAKAYVLDFLGVALYGSTIKSSKIMADVMFDLDNKKESTVIGYSNKMSCANAALVNGTASQAIEMDTSHITSVVLCGGVAVPAPLALAEREKKNGKDFLTSVVVGYELANRVGDAFLGTQYYEGFHPTGVCGVFGAAGAASKILGLDKEAITRALGIAGDQAAGLEEWKADGSWIKRWHAGKASHNGILAALLAQKGYTGPATIFEGENGFLKAFSFERKWDAGKITEGLGKEYRGHNTGFKPYASCRFTHQLIEATLNLVQKHKIEPKDINEITVRVCKTLHRTLCRPEDRRRKPVTVVDAQFSIPYVVGAAIVKHRVLPTEFTDESIRDAKVLEVAAKVKGISDSEYEKAYPEKLRTDLVIKMKDGKEYTAYADTPKGEPSDPRYEGKPELFIQDIEDKFRSLLSLLPTYKERSDKIAEEVKNLDKADNILKLTELLRS